MRISDWSSDVCSSDLYKSPFFFDAHVMDEAQTIQLELTKIYRQSDEQFISLLNSIRSNSCTSEELNYLNSFYHPILSPTEEESYINFCSINPLADQINKQKLSQLSADALHNNDLLSGNFEENHFPKKALLERKK